MTHFLRQSLATGRGLALVAQDDQLLRSVVTYIDRALDAGGVAALALTANARMTPSQRDAAVAAPLLIVERAEFATDAVQTLILARTAVRKPVLLTSSQPLRAAALASALPLLTTVVLDAASVRATAA